MYLTTPTYNNQAGQAMKYASYVYDYNYEAKSGPQPQRYFGGMFAGLNGFVWKVTEEQGTKDWFILRRFMITSTSAVHCLRKLEKMQGVPPDLKENVDVIARVLKMRVAEPVDTGNESAAKAFVEHIRGLHRDRSDDPWFNEDYLQRKITVALMKRALQHMRVPLGGVTSKADLGKLITNNLDKTQPAEDDADKEIALSILNRWFMAPIKGEATKGLREGLENEAEVLRLLKDEFFVGADQPVGEDRIRAVKVIHVGLLESIAYERVGTSVDAIVLLEVVKHNGLVYDTVKYEMACVEIKTKTSATTRKKTTKMEHKGLPRKKVNGTAK
jgi:hypothetical protein